MMTSDVLYGQVVLKPYFDRQRFEDSIYNRVITREKRINTRKKLKIADRLLIVVIVLMMIVFIALLSNIVYKSILVENGDKYIKRLESILERKIYENKNAVSSLKTNMKFDDIKMKAYMELNMITPTEKNIIHFDKSDNGFVRQYENIH